VLNFGQSVAYRVYRLLIDLPVLLMVLRAVKTVNQSMVTFVYQDVSMSC